MRESPLEKIEWKGEKMTTSSWVQKLVDGKWKMIPREEWVSPAVTSAYIINDIESYQSLATADTPYISGRAAERAYMKKHDLIKYEDMLDMPKRPKEHKVDPRIKEELIARMNR